MKISDFAMLPHQIRSVSCATSSPNIVASAGTTDQPQHVVAHRFPELRLGHHAGIVGQPHEFRHVARPLLMQRQPERREDRIGEVEPKRYDRRHQEQPGPDHVGAVDVAPGVRSPSPGRAPCRATGWRHRNSRCNRRRRSTIVMSAWIAGFMRPSPERQQISGCSTGRSAPWRTGPSCAAPYFGQDASICVGDIGRRLAADIVDHAGPEGARADRARHQVRAVEAEGGRVRAGSRPASSAARSHRLRG